ncbi:hypothetical protein J6590_096071, partial [Homalodisca vitripennis]
RQRLSPPVSIRYITPFQILFKYVESEFISGPNDGLSRMLKGLQYSYVIPLSTYPSLFNMIH